MSGQTLGRSPKLLPLHVGSLHQQGPVVGSQPAQQKGPDAHWNANCCSQQEGPRPGREQCLSLYCQALQLLEGLGLVGTSKLPTQSIAFLAEQTSPN